MTSLLKRVIGCVKNTLQCLKCRQNGNGNYYEYVDVNSISYQHFWHCNVDIIDSTNGTEHELMESNAFLSHSFAFKIPLTTSCSGYFSCNKYSLSYSRGISLILVFLTMVQIHFARLYGMALKKWRHWCVFERKKKKNLSKKPIWAKLWRLIKIQYYTHPPLLRKTVVLYLNKLESLSPKDAFGRNWPNSGSDKFYKLSM